MKTSRQERKKIQPKKRENQFYELTTFAKKKNLLKVVFLS